MMNDAQDAGLDHDPTRLIKGTEQDAAAVFDMHAGYIRTIANKMLTEFFGERCKDFEPDCLCCQRWQYLDKLTENPFDS